MKEYAGGHVVAWHTSVWPLVLSVGIIFLLPLSFTFYFVYKNPMLSVICLGIGTSLTVISIAGWVKEGFVDVHGYSRGYVVAAMPFFIVAEALLFFGLFAAYWAMRLLAPVWPPSNTPHILFLVPIIMTAVLVCSSIAIHFGEVRLERKDRKGFLKWLIAAIILGLVFVGLSTYEWNKLFGEGFSFKTNAYSTAFYSITGFHVLHVLVGLGIFIAIFIPALADRLSKPFVRAASIYWHFVDIVWFFVVSQVYFW